MARCHLNTNQEFEDQFAVSLTTHCPHTNILLQSINGCDEDLPKTIGTSQHPTDFETSQFVSTVVQLFAI